jgi:hypothetical protein
MNTIQISNLILDFILKAYAIGFVFTFLLLISINLISSHKKEKSFLIIIIHELKMSVLSWIYIIMLVYYLIKHMIVNK